MDTVQKSASDVDVAGRSGVVMWTRSRNQRQVAGRSGDGAWWFVARENYEGLAGPVTRVVDGGGRFCSG